MVNDSTITLFENGFRAYVSPRTDWELSLFNPQGELVYCGNGYQDAETATNAGEGISGRWELPQEQGGFA